MHQHDRLAVTLVEIGDLDVAVLESCHAAVLPARTAQSARHKPLGISTARLAMVRPESDAHPRDSMKGSPWRNTSSPISTTIRACR